MPQRLEEQYPLYSEKIAKAREEGYSDDEIFDHIQGKIVQAMDEGYEMQEIFDYLGSPTPGFELLPEPGEKPSKKPVKPYSIKRMTPEEIAAEEAKMGPIDPYAVRTRTNLAKVDPVSGGVDYSDEALFQRWYKKIAERTGLNPDPDAEDHKYDYRAAFLAGEGPDETGHWPSKYKDYDHPNRFVNGIDTITGEPAFQEPGQETTPTEEITPVPSPQAARKAGFGAPLQEEQEKAQQSILVPYPDEIPKPLTAEETTEPPPKRPEGISDQMLYDSANMVKDIVYPTLEYYANLNRLIEKLPYAKGVLANEAAARAFAETFKPPKAATTAEAVARFGPEVAGELAPFILSPGGPISKMMAFGVLGSPDSPVSGAASGALTGGILKALPFVKGMGKRFGAGLAAFGGPQAFNDTMDYILHGERPEIKDYAKVIALAAMGMQERPGQLREMLTEKLTRKTIREGGLPERYYIMPEQIRDMFNKVNPETITPEEMEVVRGLGLDAQGYKKALKRGLAIEVYPEQLIKTVDRPWFAHLKSLFKLEPGTEEVIKTKGKTTYRFLSEEKEAPPQKEAKKEPTVTQQPAEKGEGVKGELPGITQDIDTLTKKPADVPIIEKLDKITDLKALKRNEKRLQKKIDKIENPQAKARAQAALDKKRQELAAAGVPPEEKKEPVVTPEVEEEEPTEEAPTGEISEEEIAEETKKLPQQIRFTDEMKVREVNEIWGDMMQGQQDIEDRNAPEIEKLKAELENLKGDRSKEAKAKKKEVYGKIVKLETQAEYHKARAEALIQEAQEEFSQRVYERAKAKGIEDEDTLTEIADLAATMLTERPYIETNYEQPISQVIDDAIAEYLEEAAPEEGEGIKPAVTDKDVQKVIKNYIDRIKAETDPANFVQLRKDLEDEGLINDAQKKTINNEIDRKERELLVDETADIPQEEGEKEPEETPAEIAKREEERIAKRDKTPFIEMATLAGVRFQRIYPSEQGDIIDFHDPVTGGDYSIYEKDLTLESLREKIKQKREELGPAPDDLTAAEHEASFAKRIEEATENSELSYIATEIFENKKLSNEQKDALLTILRSRQLFIEPRFKGLTQDFAERLIREYFSTPLTRSGKVTKVSLIGGVLKKGKSGKDIDILIELNPKEFPKTIGLGFVRQIYEMLDFSNTGNYTQPLRDLGIIQRTDEAAEVVDLWFKWNDRTLHLKGGYDPTRGSFTDDDIEDVTGKYEQEPSKEIKPFEKEVPEKEEKPKVRILGKGWVSAGPGDILGQPGDPVQFYPSLENPEYMITWENIEGVEGDVYKLYRIEGKTKIPVPNTLEGPPKDYFEEVSFAEQAVTDIKAAQEALRPKVSMQAYEHVWDKQFTEVGRRSLAITLGALPRAVDQIAKTAYRHLDGNFASKVREHFATKYPEELRYAEKQLHTDFWWDEIASEEEKLAIARRIGMEPEAAKIFAAKKWGSIIPRFQEAIRLNIEKPKIKEVEKPKADPYGERWDSLDPKERYNVGYEFGKIGKGLGIDPDLMGKEFQNKLWKDLAPSQQDLVRAALDMLYPEGKKPEPKPEGKAPATEPEGEQKPYLPEKLDANEFAKQKGEKTLQQWAQDVLTQAGKLVTPEATIEYAGYWEPSKTHPNGAIQFNGPYTESSLNLRTDQFTPTNIINKLAWNYLTTDPKNRTFPFMQLDNLTNQQKADIIYGRKGVKDVIGVGEEHKKPLQKVPPKNVPPVEEGGEGGGVLPAERGPGGGAVGKPVEEGAGTRPDQGDGEGAVLPTGGGRTGVERRPGNNYRITETDNLENPGGEAVRFDNNVTAIRLLKQIEDAQRKATPEEQKALVKYVGWGGLSQVFGWSNDPALRRRKATLEDLLTKEEYEAARNSTPNAHYTSPKVINIVYAALKKMGFAGGKVLEPAVGIGNFIGLMPSEIAEGSIVTGIELDSLSARIAQQLYQGHYIQHVGFESSNLPNNYYDLAVTNAPFGDYSVYDPDYKNIKAPIHDYFIVKMVDKVRPGGIIAVISSRYTMDKKDARIRRMIAEKADLIMAVRLPDSAFKSNANTEVVTDILFLRKKVKGENIRSQPWVETKEIEIKEGSDVGKVDINEYYIKNPKNVLGKHSLTGSMYADKTYTVKGTLKEDIEEYDPFQVIDENIDNIMQDLPEGVYQPGNVTDKIPEQPTYVEMVGEKGDVKDGGLIVKHNTIYRREGNELKPVKFGTGNEKRAKALIGLKERARDVVRNQLMPQTEQAKGEFAGLLKELNRTYDEFVKKYGPIGHKDNWKILDGDPDQPFLLAIEKYDSKTNKAEKTAFFSTRTIQRYQRPTSAGSAKEALLISLNETASIDYVRMSELTNKTEEELRDELKGVVFKDPDGERWVTDDEYLSGDVRSKLAAAKAIAEVDPQYAENVEALEKVQPEDIPLEDVYIRLGQTWIDPEDYKMFISHLLEDHGRNDIKVDYAQSGTWIIRAKPRHRGNWSRKNYQQSGRSGDMYALQGRKSTLDLVEGAFNGRSPVIKLYNDDGEVIGTDVVMTAEAKRIQEEIQKALKEWMMNTPGIRDRLQKTYNERYNRIRKRVYDGSHLSLPNSNPAIKLRPHQKNAIWRIIQGRTNALLEHVVGAGKTYVMIASSMEMKRLGVVKKPILCCYKHQVPDFERSIFELYPAANVLVATAEDFTPKNRKIMQAKITTGDWDLIVISHEQFEKLPMSLQSQRDYIQDQLSELSWGIQQLTQAGARDKDPTVKQLVKAQLRLEQRLKKLMDNPKDTGVTFEELGVDMIYVDEAQKFKNLQYTTTRSRVSGLGNPMGSERANDLYMKTRYLTKRNGGKGIVFATATPISNSIVEMFTVLRYLHPEALQDRQMNFFDAWAAQFGQEVTALEVDFQGGGYRPYTRFRQFNNLAELMQVYHEVSDIQTQEMLKLPVPTIRGGKPEAIGVPASELQKAYVQWLVERAAVIKAGGIDPKEDNMLKLTGEGMKCALDLRLCWPAAPDEPGSKLNIAIKKIYDVWKQTEAKRLTQLVFCDMGTPGTEGFNVYADIKSKLVSMGVPANEVVFIHEYPSEIKKEILFDEMNQGKVRILIGSTDKMGTGMNVQKLLYHEAHLDAPWTPAEVEQREGRIVRQKNENEEVEITRFITTGTFDAYMWQTLENKQGFLAQLKRGDVIRSIEDIDKRGLSYAEMKAIASGDPLVREKIETELKINELMLQHEGWLKRRRYFEQELATIPQNIEGYEHENEALTKDLKILEENAFEEGKFKMVVQGNEIADRKEAGEKIIEIWKGIEPKADLLSPPYAVGNFRGFKIGINKFRALNDELTIQGAGKHKIEFNPSQLKVGGEITEGEVDPVGLIKRIENKLEKLKNQHEANLNRIKELKEKAEQAEKELEKKFPEADELRQKQSRLVEINAVLGVEDEGMGLVEGEGEEEEGEGPVKRAGKSVEVTRKGEQKVVLHRGGQWIETVAKKVEIRSGFDFVYLKNNDGSFTIYEKRTGIRVAQAYSLKATMRKAEAAMQHLDDDQLEQMLSDKEREIEGEKPKPGGGGETISEHIATFSATDENNIAYGSNAKAREAVLKLSEEIERYYIADTGMVFSENPEEYQSKIARELATSGRVNLTGTKISPYGPYGVKELAGLIQAWRDPTMEIVHFVLTDKAGNVLLHTGKTSGNIAEVDPGDWRNEIPELFRSNPTATKVHIVHNHPSGKAKLSLNDKILDEQISEFLKDKYGSFLAIDDGEYGAMVELSPGTRAEKYGNFVKTPGAARWMEREKKFKMIGPGDLSGYIASIKQPDRTIVIFHGTSNVIYGWTSVSDFSLVAKTPEEVRQIITDGINKFHAYKAIIWTSNNRVSQLAEKMPVGDFLTDIIFENQAKKRIVKVGPQGELTAGATITSMRATIPAQFDPAESPFKVAGSLKLFAPRATYNPEQMTEEQLEALERLKEYVRQLEEEAARAGMRFNRAFLRARGFDKRAQTQLLKVRRLIQHERQRMGTPNENAVKVLETHLETDKRLREMKKTKLRKLYRMVKRGIVDVSGNIKPELMKFGDQGKAAVINHDLIAGANSWAEVLLHEAIEKIYGKGEWGRELSSDEEQMLNYLIQSKRIIAIDNYKENIKHPGRLTGKHHEDFVNAENFARAFRELTGQEVTEDLFVELQERANKYFAVMNEQLAELYRNGLISEASYEALIQTGDYQPRRFIQHIDPENNYTFGGSRTIQVHNSGIKKITTGSFQVLENDSRQLLYQVIARTQGRIARNKANIALWDLATNVPDNGVVRKARIYGVTEKGTPIFEKTPANHEAVDVMVEGKRRRLFMPDEWAREWVMRDPSVNDQVANVIGWVSGANILRPMATGMFAPEFAITNLARDIAHIWLTTDVYSKWLPIAGVQYAKALKAVWKDALLKQGLWREYMKEGGGMSFLSTQGKMFPTATSKALEGLDYYGTYVGNFSEMINRLAIMQMEIWKGKSTREAAWVARNYIDFYQGGTWSKMLDTGIPYLNAGIQGTRGIFRAMHNDPKSFLIKLGEIFALAVGLYLANRFINPDCYDSISDSDKVRYWCITTPLSYKDKDGTTRYLYFVVAKDQGQRFFAQMAEQMTRGISGDAVNWQAMSSSFRDFWPIMAPQDMLPPTIDALLGYSTNKDFWLNQDIWKSKFYPVGKIEARDEYTRYTHPALVKIGQPTNLSPERLGYALEQYFTYGNVFTSIVGGGLRFMFDEMPGNEGDRVAGEIVTQLPGIRRIMRSTKPVPDSVLKEEADALREVYTRRIRQNREVRDWAEQYYSFKKQDRGEDAKGVLDNATTFISKQPKEDQERLKKLFKEYPLYDDIPDRSWWLSLREMPPEAKAYIWYSRYRAASPEKKKELDKLRRKMPGMDSDRFMEEIRKLRAAERKPIE